MKNNEPKKPDTLSLIQRLLQKKYVYNSELKTAEGRRIHKFYQQEESKKEKENGRHN